MRNRMDVIIPLIQVIVSGFVDGEFNRVRSRPVIHTPTRYSNKKAVD